MTRPQPTRTGTDLSPRERELAEALHRGMSRSSICAAMGVTMNTLQRYLQSIYGKLAINSQLELVLIIEREKHGGVTK